MGAYSNSETEYEYVVVGSGAGGGTVAARLAEAGHRVLLLEAGGDPLELQGGDPAGEGRLPDDYNVPVFHAFSTENRAMKWDFFVRHYDDENHPEADPKYVNEKRLREDYPAHVREELEGKPLGVLYPRAGTLGGCTAHNAQIMVYPHNDDWDDVAKLTGDDTWRHRKMRKYFQRMEDCHHRPGWRVLYMLFGINPTRHGFRGWLRTEKALPLKALKSDKVLVKTILKSAKVAIHELGRLPDRIRWFLQGHADPNDWRLVKGNSIGLRYPPLTTRKHARTGTRERVRDVARRFPDRLMIELDALATKVVFDGAKRAVGVEYLKGKRLYRAHYEPSTERAEEREVRVSREVILAGGAFNTPQLLMLSGIGPRAELDRHGIELLEDLPGVGTNLQDRYEVGVVNRMCADWAALKDARYSAGDPQYERWKRHKGVYTTNGAVLAIITKSYPKQRPLPDLFCFALLGRFPGYKPEYSKDLLKKNYLTWAILKAHTVNRAGTVKLRSADPLDTPDIHFHYFDEGDDKAEEDVESVVAGIQFVRKMTAQIKHLIDEEELPGEDVQEPEQLKQFVKDNAWGHHASCTCPIGPDDDKMAVLDSRFRVRGTKHLRVVDASVFPKIPGFFIVSSVYMIGEKAADVILADAR